MRILVTGDRNWECTSVAREVLNYWMSCNLKDFCIIQGGCPTGVDFAFRQVAHYMGCPVETFPANWDLYGKKAGPIRNQQMVDTYPDACFAFHKDIKRSKGTKDCLKRALKAAVPCFLIDSSYSERRHITSMADLSNKE